MITQFPITARRSGLNDQHADAYASRGNSYSAKGDFDRGLPDFNKAIGIQQTAIYYNGRGYAYARKKDYDRAIRLNPDFIFARKNRACVRYGTMPLGTLRVEGERVCASLPGGPIQPCFYLERTASESFRGSIAGLSFAYCDFTRARTMSGN